MSHDSLSPFLQQFSIEFERWVRTRWLIWRWSVSAAILFTPLVVVAVILFGLAQVALWSVMFLVAGLIYAVVIWLWLKVFRFLYEALAFPMVRFLAQGDPVKKAKRRPGG